MHPIRRPVLAALGLFAAHLLVVGFLSSPPTGPVLSDLIQLALGMLAVATSLGAARRSSSFARTFWRLAGLGFIVWCIGQMLGTYYGSILNAPTQRLWAVDVFYNTWTAPLIMCLFLDPEAKSEGPDWAQILDFAQIAIFVVLVYLYFSSLAARDQSPGDWRLALTMDGLVTLGFFMRAFWARSDPSTSKLFGRMANYRLIAFATDLYFVAGFQEPPNARWFDLIWSFPWLIPIVTAASWNEIAEPVRPARPLRRLLITHFLPLLFPLLVLFTATQIARGQLEIAAIAVLLSLAISYARLLLTQRERLQSAEGLRQAHALLNSIIEGTSDAIFVKDLQGRYLMINTAGARLIGRSAEEVKGKDDYEFFSAETAKRIIERDRQTVLSGEPQTYEEVGTAVGTTRIYLSTKAPYRDSTGTTVGLVGISVDISERKRAENILALQKRVLETIARGQSLEECLNTLVRLIEAECEEMLCSVLLLDEDGRSIRHGAAPSLPEAYIQAVDGAAIGPKAGSCGTAMYRKEPVIVIDIERDPLWQDYPGLVEMVKGVGLRACWSTPILSHDQRVLGSFAMYHREARGPSAAETRLVEAATHLASIAIERKRAEEGLGLFRALLDHTNDAIEVVDLQTGRFLDVNEQACRIHSYTRDEYLALSVPEIDPHVLTWGKERRQEGVFESEHRRKDGSVFPVEVSLSYVHLDKDYQVAVVRDISERKRLEEQLRQAQKMEAVGKLAGGIAHDFNNLLTIIRGYSQLVRHRVADAQTRREVERIDEAAERAAALTAQLLAFSRRQVLQPKIFNLNDLLLNLDKMLRRLIGEDIEVVIVTESNLGLIKADPGQMEQVIMNLVVNARDAMPKGGRLTLETASVELDEAYAREHSDVSPGRCVMLAVSDTGVGMNAETQARIFDPFFTTKEMGKGTGLGLSTVHGIVKQSGGNIWVYSEPGRGTTFKIYLPLVEVAAPGLSSTQKPLKVAGGSETILLVEDDQLVRELARSVLTGYGYSVLVADDPTTASTLCETHAGPIHLLLTDVVMPRLSGREVARQVLARRPDTRILYMSGYTTNAIVHHGELDAGTSLLPKPFTPTSLAAKVREVLDRT